jgi:hypothetical protein
MRVRVLLTVLLSSILIVACGDDDPSASPTPVGSVSPDATATPVSGVMPLTVGDSVELPEDLALIVETGCWQCDGTTDTLVRLRRTAEGIDERVLFDSAGATGNVTGYGFDVLTGAAAVSTCGPNCTGLGELTGSEQTIIHQSENGGVTFTPSAPLQQWFSIEGYSSGAAILVGPYDSSDGPYTVRTWPDLVDVPRPTEGFDAYPMPKEVLWSQLAAGTTERNTLLTSDGAVLFTSAGDQIVRVSALDKAGERIAILLFRLEGDEANYRLFIGHREGAALQHERTLDGFTHAGAALNDCTIIGTTDIPLDAVPTPDTAGGAFAGFLPAIIDVCEGVIHPIVDPFTREPYLNGRNLMAAVHAGPFFAVADDIGDCLNVREQPSTAASSLGCFGAGVLLRDLDESQDAEGQTWRRVATPVGDEGWASDEFLTP